MSSGPTWQGSVLQSNTGAAEAMVEPAAVRGALSTRVIRRIAPGSAFKLGAVLTGLLGAFFGLFPLVPALFGMSFISATGRSGIGAVGPLVALVLYVLAVAGYALFGGVMSALYAALYNVVAGWIGGLRVEIE